MLIAIVDDDPTVQLLLHATLEQQGYQTRAYLTGSSFLQALGAQPPDLLIVDWQLPDMSGPDVVRATRKLCGPQLPVLFATQRHQEHDVVQALEAGADDFMSKPLRLPELTARVRALQRRAWPCTAGTEAPLDFAPYRFDSDTRQVCFGAQPVALKAREYALALHLFRNEGRLLSRHHLQQHFWHGASLQESRSLDTHLARLRQLLQLGRCHGAPGTPVYALRSIYGSGYRLERLSAPLHTPP